MVSVGLGGGYLANPRLAKVHWQAEDRQLPAPRVSVAGESELWVEPAEIPAGDDIGRLGRALAAGRHGDRDELMANTAAYSRLRWGELTALTIAQVDQAARVITVDRKVAEVAGHLYVEAPKNRKYRRTIYPRRTAPPRAVTSSSDTFVNHLANAVRGVLVLLGVNAGGWSPGGLGNGTAGQHAIVIISAVVHLVRMALVVVALVAAVRRSFTGDELVVPLLTVAIVGLSITFALSTRAAKVSGVREISGILPAGAVLAGRLLAARVTAWRLVPLLSAVMAGYLLVLVSHAHRPTTVSENQQVAAWLSAHDLRYGLAQYWQSSVMSVDSGGQCLVRPVRPRANGKLNYYGC